MTRRIVLELAEDVLDHHCGRCRFVTNERGPMASGEPFCSAFGMAWLTTNAGLPRRLPECIAAEQEAARMVAIEPSTVALFIEAYDETECPSVITDGTPIEHALAVIKTMGALRQHGSKAR